LKNTVVAMSVIALSLGFIPATHATAQTFPVLAIGTLDQSRAGTFVDVSDLTYNLACLVG
jgi:hypothetical protein